MPDTPTVVAYRLSFQTRARRSLRIHVTADERYEFFLNGEAIGSGPERGDPENWFFETYELDLPAGEHMLVARVFSLGEKAAMAQMSIRHGFLLCPDKKDDLTLLATGAARWEAKVLDGYHWRSPLGAWGTGWKPVIDGRTYDWGHETGQTNGWEQAPIGTYGDSSAGVRGSNFHGATTRYHRLRPALLPPMIQQPVPPGRVRSVTAFESRPVGLVPIHSAMEEVEEYAPWEALLAGCRGIHIPPFTKRRIVVDLGNYYCARPRLHLSGGEGAEIHIAWYEAAFDSLDEPESLKTNRWHKGNRDELANKTLICPWTREDGPSDGFLPDGAQNRTYSTFWWQGGRYVQITVETMEVELELHEFALIETRYPLEMEGSFTCSLPQVGQMLPLMLRGLQMCAHETYMDCPYYEQLMYIGDTRLQALATYILTRDDALPRKTLILFDVARLPSGIIPARYPARVRQMIPPFSLWWIAMCHDYALWRGDRDFVSSLLPGVRAVCDFFCRQIGEEGLLLAPGGWNFTDWSKHWKHGTPPDAHTGASSVLNWQLAGALRQASELEAWYGEPELATLQKRRAQHLAEKTHAHFWNAERSLYADDLAHSHWSEHAQALALISGLAPQCIKASLGNALLHTPDLTRASIYFTHYLFEAYREIGAPEAFLQRLTLWEELSQNGLKTPVESPEPTRSDCHAWGAHPLIHFYTMLAGIRPVAPGFSKVAISPMPGPIQQLEARLPHPLGEIVVALEEGRLSSVQLPEGVEWESAPTAISPAATFLLQSMAS